tara:strand:+ start:1189 stop:1596 length:408 start_codon:yes stop_codon:yes gene_type:complete
MNKNELKKVLKPLIKECVREFLFEENGALSHIILEVANGLTGATKKSMVKEIKQKSHHVVSNDHLKKNKKQLLDAIGKDAYGGINLFEGTTPGPPPNQQGQGPLSGILPSNAGVDISDLFGQKALIISQKMMEKK